MKKKIISTLLATTMVVSSAATVFAADINDFPEVNKKHWGYEALDYSVKNGLLKGIAGKLEPEQNLTRAQLVTIINRVFESKAKANIDSFKDVSPDAWYYDEIAKAVKMGTVKGRSAEEMAPDAPVSRQEVFTVLFRLLALKGGDEAVLKGFKDGDKVWDYAKPATAAFIERGTIVGDNNKNINPESSITRAEFAKLMQGEFPNIVREEEGLKDIKEGNVLIGGEVRNIKDADIKGDLVLVDGLGDEKITVKNTEISDRILVRGGDLEVEGSTIKNGATVDDPNRVTKIKGINKSDIRAITKVITEEENKKDSDSSSSSGGSGSSSDTKPSTNKNKTLKGDANVDQRQYPLISPFIHPPFYNARVKVEVNKDGKVISVSDNDTASKGWDQASADPKKTQDTWNRKNKPFWDRVLASSLFKKFEGKTMDQIKNDIHVNSGEADVVTGATESSKAVKEAVLNALEGKAGKKFLTVEQTLKAGEVKTTEEGYEVVFTNTLPKDFKVKLHSVASTAYNMENVISPDKYEWKKNEDGSFTLKLKGEDFLAGKYYVNIVDESGKYRSPDFESGHGTPAHYPYFVINKGATLSFKDGKLSSSDDDLDNVNKNIEEITVTEQGKPESESVEIEPVGHHGTKGTYEKDPMFKADGTINTAMKNGRKQIPVFEAGKTYEIKVETYGYGDLTFSYQVFASPSPGPGPDEPVAPSEEKVVDAESMVDIPFSGSEYMAKVKVYLDKNNKVVKLEDNGTIPGFNSGGNWADCVEKGFPKFIRKGLEEVRNMKINYREVDAVTNATASMEAVKKAVENAIESNK